MTARRGVLYLAAAMAAYGWYTRSKAKRQTTNLSPDEEAEQQASLPPRGEAEAVFQV